MNGDRLPERFVWTKIQADAGEPVENILHRKELERLAGDGVFWWGIGESKEKAIRQLAGVQPKVTVIFTVMRSPPHPRDSAPDDVMLWEAFIGADGKEHLLPPQVIVTSRAHTRSGDLKRRHYALVCSSRLPLRQTAGGALDPNGLQNIGGRIVGSSQVTAVVERHFTVTASPAYRVTARAELSPPLVASLVAPRILARLERQLLVELGQRGKTVGDWVQAVRMLRP